MAHSFEAIGGFADFPVVLSNPSGTIVRFTLTDAANRVTQIRMIQAILRDAITQWIADNPTANNEDGVKVAGEETRYPGDGYPDFVWNFGSKFGQVTLDSTYGIDISGTITVESPYANVTG